MTAELSVGVLGPLQVVRGGKPVVLSGAKPRALLAVLCAHRGYVVSADRLSEALWGEAWPPSAASTLKSHLSRLRSILAPDVTLVASSPGYRLDVKVGSLDAARFEELVGEAAGENLVERADLLGDALSLWRGDAYGEFVDLPGVGAEAVRLEELRWNATAERIDVRLHLGEDATLIGELEALVARHPFREGFWRQLVLALYRAGRQADAVRRAAALRRLLREEAGLDPSPLTRDLEARVLADDLELLTPLPAANRPLRSSPPPVRAVTDSTSLIGREHAIVEITVALDAHRLVTITGPGGVGKTRLARRAAQCCAGRFRHGQVTVELASLREPAAVAPVIAAALDVQQRQHRSISDTVVEFLADREMLLVLDNCEHLIDAVAELTERMLLQCASLVVMTTSREPLALPGEFVHVLAPLAVPDRIDLPLGELATIPSVELFVERAAAASPGFELSAETAPAVAEICRRLDGLPLALELAAARLRVFGAQVLADRLDQRFELLRANPHTGESRHRTLLDLVEWSHELLQPHEQDLFAQLSVFAGAFHLDDAEAVCHEREAGAPVIDTLATLVDKSMVQRAETQDTSFVLLETLRDFAGQRLVAAGRRETVQRRHLDWYRSLAQRGAAGLDGPDEPAWAHRLHAQIDNFRAAHATAVGQGDVDSAVDLVVDLREHAIRRVSYEITGWAEDTMRMPGVEGQRRFASLLGVAAYGRWVRGDLETAMELAQRAAAIGDDESVPPSGLPERVMGNSLIYLGRTEEAWAWMGRMDAAARRSSNPAQLAHSLYMRSVAQTSLGNGVRGAALAREARAAAAAAGSLTAAAQAEYALGLAMQGDDSRAGITHLRRSAQLAAAAGNRWVNAFALTEVHWLTAREGRLTDGLRGFADVVDTWYRGGDWANLWLSLRHVFGIFHQLGQHRTAAVLHGALTATGTAYALPFEPADAELLAGRASVLRELLGPADYSAAVRRGAAMSDGEIVDHVLSEIHRCCGAA